MILFLLFGRYVFKLAHGLELSEETSDKSFKCLLLFQSIHQRLVASIVLALLWRQTQLVLVVPQHFDKCLYYQLGYLRLKAGNPDHLNQLFKVLGIDLTRLDHSRLLYIVEVVNQKWINQTSQKCRIPLGKLIFGLLGYKLHHLDEIISVELNHLLHNLGHFLFGLEYLELIIHLLIRLFHPLQLVRRRHNISPQQTDPLHELSEHGRYATLLLQALKKVSL